MRRYLATLHKKSDRHKKNFALLTSGGVTLAIFAGWLAVNYREPAVVAGEEVGQFAAVHEVGPLESLGDSLSASWDELVRSVKNATGKVSAPDFEQGYENMKNETFDTYGR